MQQKLANHKAILNPAEAARHYVLSLSYPDADLAPFVEHYWIVRWDLPPGARYQTEILTNPSVNVSFMRDRAIITGVVTGKFTRELDGAAMVCGVRFRVGGFHPIFRRSVSALRDKVMPAGDVFDVNGGWVADTLAQPSDALVVARLAALISAKQPVHDERLDTIARITDAIRDDPSIRLVRTVSQKFGMSERTLQELFRVYAGVGLKWIINRFRLQEATVLVTSNRANGAAVAGQTGYSDQSHLIHDFKRIIGKTPVAYTIG